MLCTVILKLSMITELTESTVTLLVEHIRACVKMLHDSLTGHAQCRGINLYPFYINRHYRAETKCARFHGKSFLPSRVNPEAVSTRPAGKL